MSKAPPPGFYVPAVLFFDQNEDLDIPSIQAHVLRLAQVCDISTQRNLCSYFVSYRVESLEFWCRDLTAKHNTCMAGIGLRMTYSQHQILQIA